MTTVEIDRKGSEPLPTRLISTVFCISAQEAPSTKIFCVCSFGAQSSFDAKYQLPSSKKSTKDGNGLSLTLFRARGGGINARTFISGDPIPLRIVLET